MPRYPLYAICIANGGDYDVFLRIGKPYKALRPHKHDGPAHFRVIDDEGEDYLYPRRWFVPIPLEPAQRRRLENALTPAAQQAGISL